MISNPIMDLVRTIGVVSREKNFAARVEVKRHDEIGLLVEEFNKMLEQIELHDTLLKQGMKELHQLKETAEFASRSKTDFLSNMSHELRTPLNAIIGFTKVLIDERFGQLNETQQEYLHDVLQSSKHLLAIINDILDLSKAEAGKMELEATNVDLAAVLNGSTFMVKEKAAKHGIHISVDVGGSLETFVADERKKTGDLQPSFQRRQIHTRWRHDCTHRRNGRWKLAGPTSTGGPQGRSSLSSLRSIRSIHESLRRRHGGGY